MSADLRALYRDVIVEHSRQPRNFRRLDGQVRQAQGYNPLCGDQVTVYVDVAGDVLRDVSFQGAGCAIATASASLMTELLKGASRAHATRLYGSFHDLVANPQAAGVMELGALAVFAGVRQFPSRLKCALLAWQTLQAALDRAAATASRE